MACCEFLKVGESRGSRWPERVAGIGRGSNSSIDGKKGGNSRKIITRVTVLVMSSLLAMTLL